MTLPRFRYYQRQPTTILKVIPRISGSLPSRLHISIGGKADIIQAKVSTTPAYFQTRYYKIELQNRPEYNSRWPSEAPLLNNYLQILCIPTLEFSEQPAPEGGPLVGAGNNDPVSCRTTHNDFARRQFYLPVTRHLPSLTDKRIRLSPGLLYQPRDGHHGWRGITRGVTRTPPTLRGLAQW